MRMQSPRADASTRLEFRSPARIDFERMFTSSSLKQDMSTNTVRARLGFSFKGETYDLDSVIDLDRCGGDDEAPDFHQLLAKAAGIDPYSYLYEVLESHEIAFSDATGTAARSCRDGGFDWAQFEQDRREERDWPAVKAIAERVLPTRDWEAAPDLKAALLAAYQAGKASAR
jgi:hypothetical protein